MIQPVAYQYLLDWHLRQYTTDGISSEPDTAKIKRHSGGKTPKIYQPSSGNWKLTTGERKRILLNNIHGVDIDSQAVEVTKLSLLLKVLEGEKKQQLQQDFILERQRILPDLGNNIKCGNSLIGSDFYDNEQMFLLDDETQYRINVFDWDKAFSEIMQRGGFDCVIGNPPYGASLDNDQRNYLQSYVSYEYQGDSYPLFYEKACLLSNDNGLIAMIIPTAWTASQYNKAFRELLVKQLNVQGIVITAKKVFADAVVETLILLAAKNNNSSDSLSVVRWDKKPCAYEYFVSLVNIRNSKAFEFHIFSDPAESAIIAEIQKKTQPLKKYCECVWGVKVYQRGKGKPPQNRNESK